MPGQSGKRRADAGLGSIAFPAISTGAYGFPREPAARIAIETVARALGAWPSIERVVFCCYREADAMVDRQVMNR